MLWGSGDSVVDKVVKRFIRVSPEPMQLKSSKIRSTVHWHRVNMSLVGRSPVVAEGEEEEEEDEEEEVGDKKPPAINSGNLVTTGL